VAHLDAWSTQVAAQVARAVGVDEIAVWLKDRQELRPVTRTGTRAPTAEELSRLGGTGKYLERSDDVVISVTGLSGQLFGALVITGGHQRWGDTERRLVESFGFERINNRKLVFRPGANLGTLFSGRARILAGPDQILPLLDDDHQAILRDHLPYPCGHYLVLEDGRYSYIVTKHYRVRRSIVLGDWPVERIRKGYFLGSDVLYMSDPALALRHWERLKWTIMLRERTVSLLADEWMLGPGAPGGIAIPRTVYVFGRKVEPQYIDKLYSELVILPH